MGKHGSFRDTDAAYEIGLADGVLSREPLTFSVLAQLWPLVEMTHHNSKVVRLREGVRQEGIARSLGTEDGGFGRKGEDVRDMFLRVTLRSGFEAFWPVRELMPEVAAHTFVAYDWA